MGFDFMLDESPFFGDSSVVIYKNNANQRLQALISQSIHLDFPDLLYENGSLSL
ncbi:hypothetical protein AsAng_0028630 [Aureispira anguillae]|uniref:Uncharacterized protein n=1 Tax=Aureispira anguillae TaxID=2864201 RepID=A0A915YFG7_9BACT|nr:hypothetical protein AsAng_0028630 [Aureispira anguillae]